VRVDMTESFVYKMTSLDELDNIKCSTNSAMGRACKRVGISDLFSDIPASEFADYKRMTEDRSVIQ
jgi:hypothetical protein